MKTREKQLIIAVTPAEKEVIRKAFGSYAAMRDYVVDIAERMVRDDDDGAKKEKRA